VYCEGKEKARVFSSHRTPAYETLQRNGDGLYRETMKVEQVVWVRRLATSGGARLIREAAHVSASEIARELGVAPSTVCRWERGERLPRGQVGERWAAILRRLSP
jgi:predicted transcriptional regulator